MNTNISLRENASYFGDYGYPIQFTSISLQDFRFDVLPSTAVAYDTQLVIPNVLNVLYHMLLNNYTGDVKTSVLGEATYKFTDNTGIYTSGFDTLRKNCTAFNVWVYNEDSFPRAKLYRSYTFVSYQVTYVNPDLDLVFDTDTHVCTFVYNENVAFANSLTIKTYSTAGSLTDYGGSVVISLVALGQYTYKVLVRVSYQFSGQFYLYVTNGDTNDIKLELNGALKKKASGTLTDATSDPYQLTSATYMTYTSSELPFTGDIASLSTFSVNYTNTLVILGGNNIDETTVTKVPSRVTFKQGPTGGVIFTVALPTGDPLYLGSGTDGRTFLVFWKDKNTIATYWKTFILPSPSTFNASNVITGSLTTLQRQVETYIGDIYTSSGVANVTIRAVPTTVASTGVMSFYSTAYSVRIAPIDTYNAKVYMTATLDQAFVSVNLVQYPAEGSDWKQYLWVYDANTNPTRFTQETYSMRLRTVLSRSIKYNSSDPDFEGTLYNNPDTYTATNNWAVTFSTLEYSYAPDLDTLYFYGRGGGNNFIFSHTIGSYTRNDNVAAEVSGSLGPFTKWILNNVTIYVPEGHVLRESVWAGRLDFYFADNSDPYNSRRPLYWRYAVVNTRTNFSITSYPLIYRSSEHLLASGTATPYNLVGTYSINGVVKLHPTASGTPPRSGNTSPFSIRIGGYAPSFSVYVIVNRTLFTDAWLLSNTQTEYSLWAYDDSSPLTLLCSGIFIRPPTVISPSLSSSRTVVNLRRINNWTDVPYVFNYSGINLESFTMLAVPFGQTPVPSANIPSVFTLTKTAYTTKTLLSGLANGLTLQVSAPAALRTSALAFSLWWKDDNTPYTLLSTYTVPITSTITTTNNLSYVKSFNILNNWTLNFDINYSFADAFTALSFIVKVFPADLVLQSDTFFNRESDPNIQLTWTTGAIRSDAVNTLQLKVRDPTQSSASYNLYACDDVTLPVLIASFTLEPQFQIFASDEASYITYVPNGNLQPMLKFSYVETVTHVGSLYGQSGGAILFKAVHADTLIESVTMFQNVPSSEVYSAVDAELLEADGSYSIFITVPAFETFTFRLYAMYVFNDTPVQIYLGKLFNVTAASSMYLRAPSSTSLLTEFTLSYANRWTFTTSMVFEGPDSSKIRFLTYGTDIPPPLTAFDDIDGSLSSVFVSVEKSSTTSILQVTITCDSTEDGTFVLWAYDFNGKPSKLSTITCVPTFTFQENVLLPLQLSDVNSLRSKGSFTLGSLYDSSVDTFMWKAFVINTTVTLDTFTSTRSDEIPEVSITWLENTKELSVSISRTDAVYFCEKSTSFDIYGVHYHNDVAARFVLQKTFTVKAPSIVTMLPNDIVLCMVNMTRNDITVSYTGNAPESFRVLVAGTGTVVTNANFLSLFEIGLKDTDGVSASVILIKTGDYQMKVNAQLTVDTVCNVWCYDSCTSPYIIGKITVVETGTIICTKGQNMLHKINNWKQHGTFVLTGYKPVYDLFKWNLYAGGTILRDESYIANAEPVQGASIVVDYEKCSFDISVDIDVLFANQTVLVKTLEFYIFTYITTPTANYFIGMEHVDTFTVYRKTPFVLGNVKPVLRYENDILGTITIPNIDFAKTTNFILKPNNVQLARK